MWMDLQMPCLPSCLRSNRLYKFYFYLQKDKVCISIGPIDNEIRIRSAGAVLPIAFQPAATWGKGI